MAVVYARVWYTDRFMTRLDTMFFVLLRRSIHPSCVPCVFVFTPFLVVLCSFLVVFRAFSFLVVFLVCSFRVVFHVSSFRVVFLHGCQRSGLTNFARGALLGYAFLFALISLCICRLFRLFDSTSRCGEPTSLSSPVVTFRSRLFDLDGDSHRPE